MKRLVLILLALLLSRSAFAQANCTSRLMGAAFTATQADRLCRTFLGDYSTDTIVVPTSVPLAVANGTTANMAISRTGLRIDPYVATPAATPVEGTNDIRPLTYFSGGTLNHAAGLPSVPTAGDIYVVCNRGANALRVKAFGTPGINGGAAGTYIPVATQQCVKCIAVTSTAWQCEQTTVPTPAGP